MELIDDTVCQYFGVRRIGSGVLGSVLRKESQSARASWEIPQVRLQSAG